MGRPRKFKVDQVEQALRNAGGIYTIAASILAKATGKTCSPNTIKNYAEEYPRIKDALEEIEDENLDLAVAGLLALVRDKDLGAIIYYLKCKGKKRGWNEKIEIDATVRSEHHAEHLENLDQLPLEDQRQVLEIIQRAREQQEADGEQS